jgi:hypothetical protein
MTRAVLAVEVQQITTGIEVMHKGAAGSLGLTSTTLGRPPKLLHFMRSMT